MLRWAARSPHMPPSETEPEPQDQAGDRSPATTLRVASPWLRLSGFLFDTLLYTAASLLTLLATGDLGSFFDALEKATSEAGQGGPLPMAAALESVSPAGANAWGFVTALYLGLQAAFLFRGRQSVGKAIVGTRIHRPDGSWANPWRILGLRVIAAMLIYNLPYLGAFLWMGGHAMVLGVTRRALHDYVADTVVLEA